MRVNDQGTTLVDVTNLRSGTRANLNLAVADVKWAPAALPSTAPGAAAARTSAIAIATVALGPSCVGMVVRGLAQVRKPTRSVSSSGRSMAITMRATSGASESAATTRSIMVAPPYR